VSAEIRQREQAIGHQPEIGAAKRARVAVRGGDVQLSRASATSMHRSGGSQQQPLDLIGFEPRPIL
jgi:hypothetical protein